MVNFSLGLFITWVMWLLILAMIKRRLYDVSNILLRTNETLIIACHYVIGHL